MSNVVISNRSIFSQNITNIDKNKVALPFNVSKEQINKLINLLTKTKIEFASNINELKISKLISNNFEIKPVTDLSNSSFTLSKSYVATMKQNIISSVNDFYKKVAKIEEPAVIEQIEKPVFVHTEDETNLRQALEEATAELDLSELQQKTNVVLANSQMEQKELQVDSSIVSENVEPIQPQVNQQAFQTQVPTVEQPTPVVNPQPMSAVEPVQLAVVNETSKPVEQSTSVVAETPAVEPQPIANQQPILPEQPVQQVQTVENPHIDNANITEQPKVKKRLFSRGNVLVIPLIVLWLGLVLFGSIKLVTSILT